MVSFPLSGPMVGTVLASLLTGFLCDYGFDGGWPSSFYLFGLASLLWAVGWLCFIRDTPGQHSSITAKEKLYVETNTNKSCEGEISFSNAPWLAIATSPAVWAIIFGHICFNWIFYTLWTQLPTYFKDVLHLPASWNGVVTSIPFLCNFICINISGIVSDALRHKGMSTVTVRKLAYGFGMFSAAISIAAASFAGCHLPSVVVLVCLSFGLSGFSMASFMANIVDIAPEYSSIIMAISKTASAIPGIVSPLVTGALVNGASTVENWRIVFLIAANFSCIGGILFIILAKGEIQSWATTKKKAPEVGIEQNCSL